jgi:hypothetical protein
VKIRLVTQHFENTVLEYQEQIHRLKRGFELEKRTLEERVAMAEDRVVEAEEKVKKSEEGRKEALQELKRLRKTSTETIENVKKALKGLEVAASEG